MKHMIAVIVASVCALCAGAYETINLQLACGYNDIYPGTVREITVTVPAGYDGREPACLYVGLDGILCNAPAVIDSLIAAGRMPVTIGVFVQPGVVRDGGGRVVRYNRSNEFDTSTPLFARFLEEKVLPLVESRRTAAGVPIRLSHRGADAMIFGLSSGGIAAFTAAWHRPDLFARVFSGVGTFVAMRDGNDLQAIVRKSEPRPLRVFLQDGTNDVWNPLFGHWYEGNRMLATALDFAGCDARYDWSDCYHGVKRASEIFAEVMEWMWHDYPEPPRPGLTKNNLLDTMLVAGSCGWEMSRNPEPPAVTRLPQRCFYPDSSIMVTVDRGTNRLIQHTRDENGTYTNAQPFYWLHSYDNGNLRPPGVMRFDGAGNLWVVTDNEIQICDQNGRVRGILMLPAGVVGSQIDELQFEPGRVVINDCLGNTYSRPLHITVPTPGLTPPSQGQG